MPTIQFTYNKQEGVYCMGFWVDGKFILRASGRDRKRIIEKFLKELEQLENT